MWSMDRCGISFALFQSSPFSSDNGTPASTRKKVGPTKSALESCGGGELLPNESYGKYGVPGCASIRERALRIPLGKLIDEGTKNEISEKS